MDQPLTKLSDQRSNVPAPTFPDEYVDWLWDQLNVSIDDATEADYAQFSQQLERQFRDSDFYERLPGQLLTLNANYKVRRGTALLASPSVTIPLDVKSWNSFFEKTYRRNVVGNSNWPLEPARGWVVPESWFGQIGDIVRTIVVVRYLDGMEEVASSLLELAQDSGLGASVARVAKAEGYYATHADVAFSPRVPIGLDVRGIPTSVEIQITTELQANIRELAHGQYETRRLSLREDPGAWQWDYRASEFSSNYIGHVLHYLEGMI